jgi:hypothetical protein
VFLMHTFSSKPCATGEVTQRAFSSKSWAAGEVTRRTDRDKVSESTESGMSAGRSSANTELHRCIFQWLTACFGREVGESQGSQLKAGAPRRTGREGGSGQRREQSRSVDLMGCGRGLVFPSPLRPLDSNALCGIARLHPRCRCPPYLLAFLLLPLIVPCLLSSAFLICSSDSVKISDAANTVHSSSALLVVPCEASFLHSSFFLLLFVLSFSSLIGPIISICFLRSCSSSLLTQSPVLSFFLFVVLSLSFFFLSFFLSAAAHFPLLLLFLAFAFLL